MVIVPKGGVSEDEDARRRCWTPGRGAHDRREPFEVTSEPGDLLGGAQRAAGDVHRYDSACSGSGPSSAEVELVDAEQAKRVFLLIEALEELLRRGGRGQRRLGARRGAGEPERRGLPRDIRASTTMAMTSASRSSLSSSTFGPRPRPARPGLARGGPVGAAASATWPCSTGRGWSRRPATT